MKETLKQIFYIFILVFIGATACETKEGRQPDIINQEDFPVVIDTVDLTKYGYPNFESKRTWLTNADYDFLYIGALTDTIVVNPFFRYNPPPPPPRGSEITMPVRPEYENPLEGYQLDWTDKTNYKTWREAAVDIKIDTSSKLKGNYHVLLSNNGTDTIYIGYGDVLPLIMEARDSTGVWRPIEKRFIYMCGNGVGSIILPPNQVALTTAPLYKGNFKTDLRLVLGENYSSIFTGSITYRQFESRFDENGNYKEEYKRENGIE
ncbi:hypothetical protein C9994_13445 [Marivirga lumbricoides]|uniref:Uncharacterized protein n=1 Tax=Marivirga lumbricoides TaxID=1046115 RepID=A0A2T4DGR2_9BACT|nr:hypothetical protein C9994_13445 [Marivirga lumbricoides]